MKIDNPVRAALRDGYWRHVVQTSRIMKIIMFVCTTWFNQLENGRRKTSRINLSERIGLHEMVLTSGRNRRMILVEPIHDRWPSMPRTISQHSLPMGMQRRPRRNRELFESLAASLGPLRLYRRNHCTTICWSMMLGWSVGQRERKNILKTTTITYEESSSIYRIQERQKFQFATKITESLVQRMTDCRPHVHRIVINGVPEMHRTDQMHQCAQNEKQSAIPLLGRTRDHHF